MKYNINEIERIIQDIDCRDPEDRDLDKFACLKKWDESFFYKLKHAMEFKTSEEFQEYLRRFKDFRKSDCSEESFQKYLPEVIYDNYICPWDYKIMKLSEKKYQKIAFELQDHIPMSLDQLVSLLKRFYKFSAEYNFETFTTYVGMYDKKLYAELLAYSSWIGLQNEKAS